MENRTMPVFHLRGLKALALLLSLGAGFEAAQATAHFERLETGQPGIAVFKMDGAIEGGETIALQYQLSSLPSEMPVAVVLNSPGGDVDEGLRLGEFFYQAKIATFVQGYGGQCLSACSLAFLGGRDRITGKPARFKMASGTLGFHQFRRPRSAGDQKKIFKKEDVDAENKLAREISFSIIRYLQAIHEDMLKLHLMLKAPSQGMNNISNEDAIALGINVMGEDTPDFLEASNIQARVRGQ
jgi:hypothetical protein